MFHKAIIESGLGDFGPRPEGDGTQIVNAMLKELGFAKGDIEKMETIPYSRMADAYNKVGPALRRQGLYIGCNDMMPNQFYIGDPLDVGFTEHAQTIPIMVGSVFAELRACSSLTNKYELSEKEIRLVIAKKYSDTADELIPLFKKAYPNKSLADLLVVDSFTRHATNRFIKKRAAYQQAPVFSYLFTFEFPFDNGLPAWHCSDIPFVFHNTCMVPICNVPGVTDKLEEQVCGAFTHFAHYGNPGHIGLPDWSACKPGDEVTMIFDTSCEVKHNFDNELIDLHNQVTPNPILEEHVGVH